MHAPTCRPAIAIGFVLAVGMTGCTRPAVEPGAPLAAFVAHLDDTVPRLMRTYEVPGAAIAVVAGGRVVATTAYGLADRDRGLPLTVDALFHTGSISKSVAAWGALRLVAEGRIGLDDPLTTPLDGGAFPPSPYPAEALTLRRALSHTTGAALGPIGVAYAPDGPVPEAREAVTRDLRVVREPGSGFMYSNPGFDLVELAIEAIDGRSFADFMADAVLGPLGMAGASFAWREDERSRVPLGYDLDGRPVPPFVYATKASGGLFATLDDVARFVAASVAVPGSADPPVLDAEGLRALHAPQVAIPGLFGIVADAYGLGHFVEVLPDGRRAVWHGGQGKGWMTHFHAIPEAGAGIVILTNSQRSWPLMARVLGDWAAWTGAGSVKFARISTGVAVMWVATAALMASSAWIVVGLIGGVRSGRRRLAPLARVARGPRLLQAALGIGLVATLAWSAAQPYLTLSSVFPGVVTWAFWACLAWAALLVVTSGFPLGGVSRSGPAPATHRGRAGKA